MSYGMTVAPRVLLLVALVLSLAGCVVAEPAPAYYGPSYGYAPYGYYPYGYSSFGFSYNSGGGHWRGHDWHH